VIRIWVRVGLGLVVAMGMGGCGGKEQAATPPDVVQSRACDPGCQYSECTPDGCEGNCGECPKDWHCQSFGQGAYCVSDCEYLCSKYAECGFVDSPLLDGCDCGPCPSGEECISCWHNNEGPTIPVCCPTCESKCGDAGVECGEVHNECGSFCADFDFGCACGDCADGVCVLGECCQPNCEERECGDDGCSGVCGICPDGSACSDAGKCECIPDCEDRQCGSDGCGGSCGSCPPGVMCLDGQCCCDPDCFEKECGPDGIGGYCGNGDYKTLGCPEGLVCNDGKCEEPCEPDCTNKECGDDGCGGSCGFCSEDMMCHPDYLCGPIECPLVLQNAPTVRLVPLHLSPVTLPGHALDLDFDGQLDNGFPDLLAALLPLVDDFFDEPLDLTSIWQLDISDLGDDPHPLLVMENFNVDGEPFTVAFHYGLLAQHNANCVDGKGVCSYLVDPDLFKDLSCEGKVVLEDAVVQGGKLYAGGPNAETWWVYLPGRLYIPASAQAYMLRLQADVEVTDTGVHLTNGLLGFATSFQHFMHRGGCYAQAPNNPVSCEILPPLEDPYNIWYDTQYGVSVAFQFTGYPANVDGICQPKCAGEPPDAPDGCGGLCHYDKACAVHGECGDSQLCLRQQEQDGQPTDVCGLCAEGSTCVCGAPLWSVQYICTTDADCETNLMCGDQCDDCAPCPKCIHGWCAHETFEMVECLCTGCA
jgi:hypothetical protein